MNRKKCIVLLFLILFPSFASCKGILIEICGIDGSGKTTLARGLQKKFKEEKFTSVVLKPSHGEDSFYPFLNTIRKMSEDDPNLKTSIAGFIDCYFSLYLLTQKEAIEKELEQNDFVILDRYICSHRACQMAFGKQTDSFDAAFRNLPQADFVFLLSLPASVAVERITLRGNAKETYENETFLTKLQSIFLDWDFTSEKGLLLHKSSMTPPDVLVQEVFESIKNSSAF